jgi:parallel beta-helix repeat protein
MPQQSGYHDVQKRIREYMSIGAGAPITFQGNGSISLVSGGGSGLDIAGQHDLVIAGMTFSSGNGVTISNSSAITLRTNRVVSNPRAGIDLDAATHDVQVRSNLVNSNGYASGYGFDGIRVAGTSNVVVDNTLQANGAVVGNDNVAGIDVVSGAVNTVVADNRLLLNRRDGILVAGRGTDVVNNTVDASCRDGPNLLPLLCQQGRPRLRRTARPVAAPAPGGSLPRRHTCRCAPVSSRTTRPAAPPAHHRAGCATSSPRHSTC